MSFGLKKFQGNENEPQRHFTMHYPHDHHHQENQQ